MICRKCGKESSFFSLKAKSEGKAPNLCKECYLGRKNQTALVGANKKAQNILLSLEKRLEDLSNKIDMLEISIASIARMEALALVKELDLTGLIKPLVSNLIKDLDSNKMQQQILKLNNRIIKLEESK